MIIQSENDWGDFVVVIEGVPALPRPEPVQLELDFYKPPKKPRSWAPVKR